MRTKDLKPHTEYAVKTGRWSPASYLLYLGPVEDRDGKLLFATQPADPAERRRPVVVRPQNVVAAADAYRAERAADRVASIRRGGERALVETANLGKLSTFLRVQHFLGELPDGASDYAVKSFVHMVAQCDPAVPPHRGNPIGIVLRTLAITGKESTALPEPPAALVTRVEAAATALRAELAERIEKADALDDAKGEPFKPGPEPGVLTLRGGRQF